MRFHVLGLPFTQTNKTWNACAYTQKVLNFCKMMTARGHQVTHYGAEGSTVDGEHVTVMTAAEQASLCGVREQEKLSNVSWDTKGQLWEFFNHRCIAELKLRIKPEDFACHIAGCSSTVADAITNKIAVNVEYGIGYPGSFAACRAFESPYLMHSAWVREQGSDPNGNNYDVSIPNYFDVADFPVGTGGDYLLFVGRIIARKGLHTAVQVAKRTGMELVVAGQGGHMEGVALYGEDGQVYTGCKIRHVGHVNVEQRGKLMGGARAIMVPTVYVEPFGGVNVEAQLCGTPAITSDWGGFIECVEHGKTGYRCRTLDQWIYAAKNAGSLDRNYIRQRAIDKYSLEKVGSQFEEWFQSIKDRWRQGWNTLRPERTQLNWLAA